MATVGSTVNLCQRGWKINHKLVYKLMDQMGLKSKVRPRKKYTSYQGQTSHIAKNLLDCNVTPEQPNTVCVSDVTEFLGGWYEGLSFIDHGSKRPKYSGTRVVDIPVNEVDVYLVKECDHVA
ncbi:hypothetical protein FRC0129_00168 [Corynebacterium diphtheriae]|nr:hypothetical protein CIP107549_00174 [Corynebacterium diphtheriae]CAB0731337.1 hypothetical protein FRC0129_00168 [Corynebacterium diphtheriae]